MMSTQRFLVILIMLNVFVSIYNVTTSEQGTFDDSIFDRFTDDIRVIENGLNEDETKSDGWVESTLNFVETSFFSLYKIGKLLWEFVLNMIYPFSIPESPDNSPIENTIIKAIEFFRCILLVILVIEIIFVKNKKTT